MRTPRRLLILPAILGAAALLAGCQGSTPAAGSDAPAHTVEHAIVLGAGAVDVQLWTDASCPYCALLDDLVGEDLADWVADGDITWTIHPMNYVSGKHGEETDFSTRAANLLAAVADAGEQEDIPAVSAALLRAQPGASAAPDDDALLELARRAGVEADLADAVRDQRFADWVQAANDQWLGAEIPSTGHRLEYVPTLVVDGDFLVLQGDETDAERVREAVESALGE